jgi:hypothetical protein
MRISLIVTDASPLITLAVAGALDILLMPEVRVIIPDMVSFEVTRHINKPGSRELLDWISAHQFSEVFVGSTEVFYEFLILASADEILQNAVKTRGEAIQKRVIITMSGVENMEGSWPNFFGPK